MFSQISGMVDLIKNEKKNQDVQIEEVDKQYYQKLQEEELTFKE